MSCIPKPQEIYKHFKGNIYQIITLAEHSETGEMMVVYQALYGDFKMYTRPLSMFLDEVDRIKYPNAIQKYRFERVVAAEKNCEVQEECFEQYGKAQEELPEEPVLDELVLEFLDADSHEKRLNILAALHHRITNDMITIMAVACDVEVSEGTIEDRYSQLKNCLLMLDRFEIQRR